MPFVVMPLKPKTGIKTGLRAIKKIFESYFV